jgi:hypothetical protein
VLIGECVAQLHIKVFGQRLRVSNFGRDTTALIVTQITLIGSICMIAIIHYHNTYSTNKAVRRLLDLFQAKSAFTDKVRESFLKLMSPKQSSGCNAAVFCIMELLFLSLLLMLSLFSVSDSEK